MAMAVQLDGRGIVHSKSHAFSFLRFHAFSMLRSYVRVALRSLWTRKTIAGINVAGLALGSAVVILIALFVYHEMSYDAFHAKADRLVQIVHVSENETQTSRTAFVPAALPAAMDERVPGVERTVTMKQKSVVVRRGDQSFEADALYAGPSFFEMFSFPLVHGSASKVLDAPDGVVVTTKQARRIFGRADVAGETVDLRLGDAFETFTVSGVAAPAPATSSIPLGIVLPYSRLADVDRSARDPSWRTLSPLLYAELPAPGDTDALARALRLIRTNEMPDADSRRFELLPITDTHLTTEIYGQLQPTSDPLYSYILAGLAAFILVLAVINFTTLSLARSADRGREVGMRKTLGAARRQVMAQFGGEALLATAISLALGVTIALLTIPVFSQLVGRTLDSGVLASPLALGALAGLWLVVGLAAGSYPAAVLSGFTPITALRERSRLRRQPWLIASLVTLQFVLAIGLLASTFVMWSQFDLLQEKNLGFQREHVVQIDAGLLPGSESDRLRERLQQLADSEASIQHATGAWGTFGVGESIPARLSARSEGQEIQSHAYRVSDGFLETFDLPLTAGRGFSADRSPGGGAPVVVNQSFVDAMGWDDPIGKPLSVQFNIQQGTVVGVVEDFHFQSLRHAIAPLALHTEPIAPTRTLFTRIAPGQTPAALDALRATWTELAPDLPLQLTFLDDAVQQQYEADRHWAQIVSYASGFAIFIAALGLIGLALLAAQQRMQEVSIRKVLGASDASVVGLVARRFVGLVALATIGAVPLAYVGVDRWLETFAYRIDLGWQPFAGAAALVVLLAGTVVALQVWRVTHVNPAQVLRAE